MYNLLSLIPVLPFQHKDSMLGLADELSRKLEILQESEQFRFHRMNTPRVPVIPIGGRYTKFLTYQWTKHVSYPRSLRRYPSDYYLISDHSYGHMAKYLPPSRTISFCHDLMPLELPGLLKSRIELRFYIHSVRGLTTCNKILAISEQTRLSIKKFSIKAIREDTGY